MDDHPAPRPPLRLRGGQVHHCHMPAGTTLVAVAGRVHIASASRWLGETVLTQRQWLEEGSCLRLEESGWIALSTEDEARVLCSPPPGLVARLHDGAANLEAWFRRCAGAPTPGDSALAMLLARLRGLRVLENRVLGSEVRHLRQKLGR